MLNISIVGQNIQQLMKAKSITQVQLAEALGMSQPNLSKALRGKDKKTFTFAQIVDLAEYFGVSIDSLVGSTSFISGTVTQRSIGELLYYLISQNHVKCQMRERDEDTYTFNHEDGEFQLGTKRVTYPLVFFPEYWHIPRNASPDEYHDFAGLMDTIGNETGFDKLNAFLRSLLDIEKAYRSKAISDEIYKIVVENLLLNLPNLPLSKITTESLHCIPDFLNDDNEGS